MEGRTSGLFEEGDIVTWRARHFGLYQRLLMQVYKLNPYASFEDKMLSGIFKSIRHKHSFSFANNQTIMLDEFYYALWLDRQNFQQADPEKVSDPITFKKKRGNSGICGIGPLSIFNTSC